MPAMWTKCFLLLLSVFVLQVLRKTFPQHTFLMNGLIHGVKVSTWNRREWPLSHQQSEEVKDMQVRLFFVCFILIYKFIW